MHTHICWNDPLSPRGQSTAKSPGHRRKALAQVCNLIMQIWENCSLLLGLVFNFYSFGRQRSRGFLSTGSLPKSPPGQAETRPKAGTRNSIQVSHAGVRNHPSTRSVLAGSWNRESGINQVLNARTLMGKVGIFNH